MSRRLVLAGALCAVVTVAFFLRSYHLDLQSFWEEELFSVDLYAGKNLFQMIQFNVNSGDTQPPLYYVLLQSWMNLAGRSEFSARYLSVLFSTLTIPLVYLFGRQLFGRRVGVIAAILAMVNPFQVWYAQEARTYALTTLLTLASTICFLRAASAQRRTRLLVAYVVVTNLAILSHYFSYFVMAAQDIGLAFCWLIWRVRKYDGGPLWDKQLVPFSRSTALAQALVFVPYLPWAPFAARVISTFPGWHEPLSVSEMFQICFQAFTVGTSIDTDLARWFTVAFFLLAATGATLGLASRYDQHENGQTSLQSSVFVLVYFLLPFAGIALYFTYTGRTIFHERYFIIVTPALMALLARALVWGRTGILSRAWALRITIPAALFLFVVVASALSLYNYYYLPEYHKADVRAALNYVANVHEEGDAIVTTTAPGDLLVEHYKPREVPAYQLSKGTPFEESAVAAELSNLLKKYRRIWLLPYGGGEIDPFVEDWLNKHAYMAFDRWYAKGRMLLYVAGTELPHHVQPTAFNFANVVSISSVRMRSEPVLAGDVVPVQIDWKRLNGASGALLVALDIVDQVNQHHARLLRPIQFPDVGTEGTAGGDGDSSSATQRFGLQVPYGTPPGTYDIEARVISEGTSRELEVLDDGGMWTGVKAVIGSIQVRAQPNTPVPALNIPTRLDTKLSDELKIIGHDLSEVTLNVGQPFSFALYWQATQKISQDVMPVIELKSSDGSVVARYAAPPAGGLYPMHEWAPQEVVRDVRTLVIPREASSGLHTLSLHLEESGGDRIGPDVILGKITVIGRTRIWAAPPIANSTDAVFGSLARLLGYDLETGGDEAESRYLQITLYWQAIGETSQSCKAFVHLLDADGRIVNQDDDIPASGSAPTGSWVTDEVIVDRHKIALPNVGPEPSRIRVGLYDAVTLSRLPATVDGHLVPDQAPVFDITGKYR